MALENFNYLDSLVPTNPVVSDGLVNGDDHIRGIKLVLKNTFPSLTGAVTATQDQIDAVTALLVNGVLRANGAVPPGAIMDFGMAVAPTGWIECDGQAVSRTTYADLYNAIGTTWGAGDGSTTFNLPPAKNRYRRHRDPATGSAAGAVGNLQAPVNLTHTHAVSGNTGNENASHYHTFSGTTNTESEAHTHPFSGPQIAGANNNNGGGGGAFAAMASANGSANTGNESAAHTHNYEGNTNYESAQHTHAISLTSAASGDANEARPLSATVLTCIKT